MDVEFQPVASSNVDSVGYDEETKTLAIRFLNGSEYHYHGVPPNTFEALLSSDSVGQFLNMVVKPQFPFVQV